MVEELMKLSREELIAILEENMLKHQFSLLSLYEDGDKV